jgi:hypothetical protein
MLVPISFCTCVPYSGTASGALVRPPPPADFRYPMGRLCRAPLMTLGSGRGGHIALLVQALWLSDDLWEIHRPYSDSIAVPALLFVAVQCRRITCLARTQLLFIPSRGGRRCPLSPLSDFPRVCFLSYSSNALRPSCFFFFYSLCFPVHFHLLSAD